MAQWTSCHLFSEHRCGSALIDHRNKQREKYLNKSDFLVLNRLECWFLSWRRKGSWKTWLPRIGSLVFCRPALALWTTVAVTHSTSPHFQLHNQTRHTVCWNWEPQNCQVLSVLTDRFVANSSIGLQIPVFTDLRRLFACVVHMWPQWV